MKRKLMAFTAGFACFLLALPFCVRASDATHIAFTSPREGNDEIYIMNISGKNLQNLTNHPAEDSQPAFSPDGQWLAFVSDRDGTNRIYLMNRNHNELRLLTNHLMSIGDIDPAWSPDGQWIAFTSFRERQTHIYKISVNSQGLQQLTRAGWNTRPKWSPDGDQIIFHSQRKKVLGIYVMKANGKEVRRVIPRNRRENQWQHSPTWSPDGKEIAYVENDLGKKSIYIMTATGQNNRRITWKKATCRYPQWSPDGHWIAYELEVENPWGNLNRDSNIHLVSPDGIETRQLTKHPARDRFSAWVPEAFLSVSPTAEKQTTLWGRLKQSVHD